jgi:hypothetical protein
VRIKERSTSAAICSSFASIPSTQRVANPSIPIASNSTERITFEPISGMNTLSSKWPCIPPTVTAW